MDFTSGSLTATAAAPAGISNSASQLVLPTVGCGGVAFTVSNAAGTAAFWATGDGGANWTAMAVSPASGGNLVTNANVAGLWQVNVAGYTHVALVATAITGASVNASIHTSPVSAFESGGGGGPGGMVPTGSTGIVSSLFTTTGGSAPATYNPSTGALNIPVYAPRGTNQLTAAVSSNLSTTSTTVVSSGFGLGPFTALFNPLVLVCFNWNTQLSAVNAAEFLPIYRTTGAIPASGAGVGGSDVELIRPRAFVAVANGVVSVSGTFLDTSLLVGTAYRYYLAFYSGTSQTITIVTPTPTLFPSLQVVELK